MKRAAFSLALGLIGLGLFFASVAMAAPNQPLAAPSVADGPFVDDPITDTITDTVPITETPTISDTVPMTHPVASAIANFFEVNYSDIANLHFEEGYGFGVIAHAYFVAQKLNKIHPDSEVKITPEDLLNDFSSGLGWGEIMKKYELHPGQAGRGGNLGLIMSSRKHANDAMGDTWMPPGQLKKTGGEDGDEVPPKQLKKSDDDGSRGGPPNTPPGQGKDKDKGKGKGKK